MNDTNDAPLYVTFKDRAYRIRASGTIARIERQAHNGHSAEAPRTYTYPYILESGRYWNMSWCERLIKRYENDLEKDAEKVRVKGIHQTAPAIHKELLKLIKGKPDTLESGYEVARQLQEKGYTGEQVMFVAARVCPPNIRGGIQIEYTGLYD